MDWLLELVGHVFRFIFDSARRATLRDESRPRWLRNTLVISYYVLPTLILVSILVSWKLVATLCGLFVVSLFVGATTESDDPKFY